MTDYVTPESPLLSVAQPDLLSQWGGPDPAQGFGQNVIAGYKEMVANNRYAYQLRIGDALNENSKKMRSVGLSPPAVVDTAFHIPVIGSYLSDFSRATDFQHVMAMDATIAGPDERYANATRQSNKVRMDIQAYNKLAEEAKVKYPELGIQTADELHNGVVAELKRDLTPDPRSKGFMAGLGEFVGGAANIASPSDPFAVLKAPLAFFGGIGPSSITRILSMAAAQAGVGALEQATDPSGRRALLGMPEQTTGGVIGDLAMNFAFGAVFGAAGEGMAGKSGREALNESYSWLSLSKRQNKVLDLHVPGPAVPPEPKPVPPPPTPVPSGVPGAIERLGQPLPGLPRGKLPTTAEEYAAAQAAASGGRGGVNAALDITETSPIAFAPRDQQVRLAILDQFKTKAEKTRVAKQLDQVMAQLMTDGVAPQDVVAATRLLSDRATAMPDVRVWQGPGAGLVKDLTPDFKTWISEHVDNINAKDPKSDTAELAARLFDPETFAKIDAVNKDLKTEKTVLQRIIDLHDRAAKGDKKADAGMIIAHENARLKATSAGGRARALQAMKETMAYTKELLKVRPGGTRPPAPKHLDQIAQAARVAALQEKRDALLPVENMAYANSRGLLDLNAEERDALEGYVRGTTRDTQAGSWRFPAGKKRAKNAKSPYDIKQMTGPSKAELFAQRELDMPQLSDPLAVEGAKPGEGPIDVATRVNQTKRETMEKDLITPEFKAIGDFLEVLHELETAPAPKTTLPSEQITRVNAAWLKDPTIVEPWRVDARGHVIDEKTGNIIGHLESEEQAKARQLAESPITKVGQKKPPPILKPIVPRLASGEALGNLAKMTGFELDGKDVGMKVAWDDVKAELDAIKAFTECRLVP